jgi:hypothetical protein
MWGVISLAGSVVLAIVIGAFIRVGTRFDEAEGQYESGDQLDGWDDGSGVEPHKR